MRKELLRISHVDLERDGELLLDDLEFQMFAGEIVGLVARNRKGQKEMVDLICRNDPISLGSVWYDGNVVNSYAYSSGESNKVALIEQKSHLVQGLSVVDNLFILREGFRKYFINEQVIFSQAVRFFEEKGLKVDLEKRVENLTELERCFVELGKALLSGCHLIIVDNPANYLSQYELFEFQQMLKKIRKEGISVLYVGNHHQELFKIADRTALFSDGHIYKVFERDEMTDEKMAPYISEWKIMSTENDQDAEDDGILHFHTVGVGNLNGLRFILHRGECMTILDKENKIAGDMMDLMTGKKWCRSGWITVDHVTYTQKKAADYLDEGIAVIPADGVNRLLFLDGSYMENLTFLLDRKLKKSLIPGKIYRSIHSEYLPLVGPVIDAPCVRDIPQEDQFALLYHKMNLLRPRIMVCIQPLAKGDMFCRMRILNVLRQIQKQGTAILMITASISDTLDISDRLLVVEQGKVAAVYEKSEFKRIVR